MDDLGYYLGIDPLGALATVIATVLLYLSFAALLRWWGQRIFASPSSFDLAVVTVLGAIVGRAILGMTPTLSGAVIAIGTLIACEYAVGRVRRTARRGLRRHRAVAVMVAGRVDREVLRRYDVDDVSLWSALRSAGLSDPHRAALVVLESTGRFSVLVGLVHEAALTGVRHADVVRERLAERGLLVGSGDSGDSSG